MWIYFLGIHSSNGVSFSVLRLANLSKLEHNVHLINNRPSVKPICDQQFLEEAQSPEY